MFGGGSEEPAPQPQAQSQEQQYMPMNNTMYQQNPDPAQVRLPFFVL